MPDGAQARLRRHLGIVRPLLAWAALVSAMHAVPSTAGADAGSAPLVRGVVRAEASAVVASELVARILAMPFRVGQAFSAGDMLITFDCRRYEADLRAAEAEVRTHKINVETQRQLLSHRATGANDLALAEAKHHQAIATADSLRVRTSQCVIVAPYDGQVVDRAVDVFEMPQANAPLMKIVKRGTLEIDLIVPSSWAVWLKPGHEFSFKIEETGGEHAARLMQAGAVVDPVSRTMKVTAVLLEPGALARPGMSGAARLTPSAAEDP